MGEFYDRVAIPGLTGATHAAVGCYRSCALRSNSDVVCWGGTADPPPAPALFLSQAKEIAGGSGYLSALSTGPGATSDLPSPHVVLYPSTPAQALDLRAIEDNVFVACYRTPAGLVSCWDYNGTITPRSGFD